MSRLFQDFTPKEIDEFIAVMEMRDANGQLTKTGIEVAIDLLGRFMTHNGSFQPREAAILGKPAYGRSDVIVDLIRAICGPNPTPQAWFDAIREGTFGLGMPIYYRRRGKADAKPKEESPGHFLPRMLAQYRIDSNDRRKSPIGNVALYAEMAMITAAVMMRAITDACGAKAALGVAWVVNIAVDKLPSSIKRQIDALAEHEPYLVALREAIKGVTLSFADQAVPERTNDEVQHSLPPSADVDAFFDGREQRHAVVATAALVEAVKQRALGRSTTEAPSALDPYVDEVIAAARATPLNEQEMDAVVRQATAYLDAPEAAPGGATVEHHERLRLVMPSLTHRRSVRERGGKLMAGANTYAPVPEMGEPRFYADEQRDLIYRKISERVVNHAREIGPPPPGTPLEHLAIFEAAANTLALVSVPGWPAEEAWFEAGLNSWPDGQSIEPTNIVNDLQINGLAGLDVVKARELFPR